MEKIAKCISISRTTVRAVNEYAQEHQRSFSNSIQVLINKGLNQDSTKTAKNGAIQER